MPAQARTGRKYQNQDVNPAFHFADVCDCECSFPQNRLSSVSPSSSSSFPPASFSLQHGPPRQTREPLCGIMRDYACLCTQSFYPGGLYFLPSGAASVFAEELGSHINSSGTCQQPPSSSDVTYILLPWDDSGIQGTRGLHLQDLRSHDSEASVQNFHPAPELTLTPPSASSGPLFPSTEEKLEGQGKACSPINRWGD